MALVPRIPFAMRADLPGVQRVPTLCIAFYSHFRMLAERLGLTKGGVCVKNCIQNVVCVGGGNVGDIASSPALYFDFKRCWDVCDFGEVFVPGRVRADVPCVVGGGGVFHLVGALDEAVRVCGRPLIGWGVGHNVHGGGFESYGSVADKFDLLGVRDWKMKYPWVPCVSCMSALFDRARFAVHEHVVFDHTYFRTGITGLPTMENHGVAFSDVLDFLASGETVITSSYHGAYWAALLGRRCLVCRPFSSKFALSRYRVPFVGSDSWCGVRGLRFPDALYECRRANEKFAAKVVDLLGV